MFPPVPTTPTCMGWKHSEEDLSFGKLELLFPTHSHDPCQWGESDVPFVVHQPASPSIWLAVQSLRRGLSTNPGRQYGAYVGAVEEMMCVVCVSVTEWA